MARLRKKETLQVGCQQTSRFQQLDSRQRTNGREKLRSNPKSRRLFSGVTSDFGCFLNKFVIAVLIKLETKGPVFFKQGRPGIDEKEFFFLKNLNLLNIQELLDKENKVKNLHQK